MGKVTFKINGLAALYKKEEDDFWTVIFPTDVDCHKARLSVIKDGEVTYTRDLAEVESTKLISDDSIAPEIYESSEFNDEILDLTNGDFYPEGLQKNPNLPAAISEKRLEIKHAYLFSEELREDRINFVFPMDNPERIRLLTKNDGSPKVLTNIVGGEIELKDLGKISIEINGEIVESLSDGDQFEIDNDCIQNDFTENDFQKYQKLFLSKNVNKQTKRNEEGSYRLFETVSIYKPDPNVTFGVSIGGSGAVGATRRPPLICDPIKIGNPTGL